MFEKCILMYPNFSIAHNDLGLALMEKWDYDMAIKSLNKSLETVDQYSSSFYRALICCHLWYCYLYTRNKDKAVRLLNQVLLEEPRYERSKQLQKDINEVQ